jgi:hypothetical protein
LGAGRADKERLLGDAAPALNTGPQTMKRRHLRYFVAVAEKVRARRMRLRASTDAEAAAGLALLAYELLDAHADTAQLAGGLAYDRSWAAHLDYLRALQRKGRETLARTASDELSSLRWAGLGSLDVR